MKQEVSPIGLFRHNDFVMLFLDTEVGHAFFQGCMMVGHDRTTEMFGKMLADKDGDINAINELPDGRTAHNILVVRMDQTNIPRDMPSHKFVGMDPSYNYEGVPTFTPGQG